MLSFTTGSHESMFSVNGINGDMNVTLWPLQVVSWMTSWIWHSTACWQISLFKHCLLSPEWHPALLWFPSSGPSGLLGSIACCLWGSHHHAGGLAFTAARPTGRTYHLLCSVRQLWWREGVSAEAWGPSETCQGRVWSDSGNPPGKTTPTPQPDESWNLKDDSCVLNVQCLKK